MRNATTLYHTTLFFQVNITHYYYQYYSLVNYALYGILVEFFKAQMPIVIKTMVHNKTLK